MKPAYLTLKSQHYSSEFYKAGYVSAEAYTRKSATTSKT